MKDCSVIIPRKPAREHAIKRVIRRYASGGGTVDQCPEVVSGKRTNVGSAGCIVISNVQIHIQVFYDRVSSDISEQTGSIR
ncbi:hypothetical protein SDC9_58272 [bioreactor metagenome]|uniref:Uncharacterized protein n=1 Tax=bioreactor metagenome TaxID=1076179 RepID=A0A644X7Y5_9ZZZZ